MSGSDKTTGRVREHSGTVTAVRRDAVDVEIMTTSACASCEAHSKCGFAEGKNKTVTVPVDDPVSFSIGQRVTVNIDESRGMTAVWIAYVLPALLMLSAIIGLALAKAPEWLLAVASLAVLGLYVAALYLLRTRISSRFTLTITT